MQSAACAASSSALFFSLGSFSYAISASVKPPSAASSALLASIRNIFWSPFVEICAPARAFCRMLMTAMPSDLDRSTSCFWSCAAAADAICTSRPSTPDAVEVICAVSCSYVSDVFATSASRSDSSGTV